WRTQLAALLACVAAGFALLLVERALALEISAPRLALVLRVLGWGFPLVGALALAFGLAAQRPTLLVIGAIAVTMGVASVWVALRTSNRACVWLLAGFVP